MRLGTNSYVKNPIVDGHYEYMAQTVRNAIRKNMDRIVVDINPRKSREEIAFLRSMEKVRDVATTWLDGIVVVHLQQEMENQSKL